VNSSADTEAESDNTTVIVLVAAIGGVALVTGIVVIAVCCRKKKSTKIVPGAPGAQPAGAKGEGINFQPVANDSIELSKTPNELTDPKNGQKLEKTADNFNKVSSNPAKRDKL
jgi:hypothetical protein